MPFNSWTARAVSVAALSLVTATAVRAADPAASTSTDVSGELNALKTRIADLEAQQHENWMTKERESQIRGIVEDVLKDARSRGQFADGVETGYTPGAGFYIQTPDKNFKLAIGGFIQLRYEFAQSKAINNRTQGSRTVGSSGSVKPTDPGDASGIDIRRARISFSGNAFSPDIGYKFEGDFYGGSYVNSVNSGSAPTGSSSAPGTINAQQASSGAFTVTDAYITYKINDLFKLKMGSYKVPFSKAELTSDTQGTFQERAEVNAPFDPVRALGLSLYGDIVKDQLSYEVAINNGGSSFFGGPAANTYRRVDTNGALANIDNRPAFYSRVQWAGNAKTGEDGKVAGGISDFAEESDLRKDNRDFIWMLGGAAGYESQNASNNAFPSPSGGTTDGGLSNGAGNSTAGPYIGNYVLNGSIYRGTVDYSVKYQGLSINTAAYIQEINARPGATSLTSTTPTVGPFGAGKSSFFQWGTYGQVGYFVIPQKLELVARAGLLNTEGTKDIGDFYSVGANYYVYGNNFKIQSDFTYVPEAPYTDAGSSLLQNTHDLIFRVQAQLRF